jgi:nicotinamidase-related amidase
VKKRRTTAVIVWVALMLTWALPHAEEAKERVEIKPVLLVMDVQNTWMPNMAEEDRASAPAKINECIAMFREYGHPVIRVYHMDPKRGPEPGTEAFEFHESIAVTDSDQKVVKAHPSAFTKTELEQDLRASDRNVVFLCGLSATGCVLATYFGAMDREFIALMVQEALLSGDASHTDVIEDICYSVSLEELKQVMGDPHF